MTVQLRGEVANMRSAIQNFALALPLAVVLIYLVMVALFRSFIDPLIILVAVPLGWIGTVVTLHPDEHVGQRGVDDRDADDDGHRGLEQYSARRFRQSHGPERSDRGTCGAGSGTPPHPSDSDDGAGNDFGLLPWRSALAKAMKPWCHWRAQWWEDWRSARS